ncbi:MAG: glycosyltransferase family 2 protein [Deltaproteobacteria bacterium]|nr:glycosyltransferase family 2 protein [Deltaproteobacteria bacterium]
MDNPRVLVIIPAYNEEASIKGVVNDVRANHPSADILVIDDGSSDKTFDRAAAAGAVTLKLPYNLGIGATVQTGFKYALKHNYDIAVQVDGDGQHPAVEIQKLVSVITSGKADLAVGSRFLGQGNYKPSVARGIGITIFSNIVSYIVGARFTDTTSGFRATGKNAIKFLAENYPDDYPEVEALVVLSRRGFKITEVPVTMSERTGGTSSITAGKSVYYMAKVMLAIFIDLLRKVN